MKYKACLACLMAAISSISCKEDTLEVYHGDNYVHFTPGTDGSVKAEYNFATGGTTAETEVSVPVEMRIWGYLPESDFICRMEADEEGTTALEGDFVLPGQAVFRKGLAVDTLWVTVRRRQELLATDYTLTVALTGADGHVAAPSGYLKAVISVKDRLTGTAPTWWNTTRALGDYSDMKFRVFNIYLGRYLDSLADYTTITFEEEVARFKAWWADQWASGNYRYYAEDGTTPLYETIPD
ncbi:MAG: DUF4843 domain-containing protein [Bacteroidetes bacterium]|uniref:DUF4843 domain-containing protein n=1 Tax=Candidatus Cryptobacteroides merdigallinarum TaxID=2840770 RepID=A0A9D9EM01_9BACT|nr:DUF4843 domain-containing protein [Candidatus Cryptobacteroides merdigallinarum]